MIQSQIELRTLEGSISPKQKNSPKDSVKEQYRKQRVVDYRITSGLPGLNFKENHYSNENKDNMNKKISPPSKSPEPRKPGIRERLFGKTPRTGGRKPKRDGFPRQDSDDYYRGDQDDVDSGVGDSLENSHSHGALLRVKRSQLRGHCFEPHQGPTWCDACEDFIWGLYKSASTRCRFCKYTCHTRCLQDVNLDCPKAPAQIKSIEDITKETLDILNEREEKESVENKSKLALPSYVSSIDELRKMINEYNRSSTLIMTLQHDGTFHGFVRVHMNMTRPVNVDASSADLTMRGAIQRSSSRRSRRSTTPAKRAQNGGHGTAQPIPTNPLMDKRTYSVVPYSSQQNPLGPTGPYSSLSSGYSSVASSVTSESSLFVNGNLGGTSESVISTDSTPVVTRRVNRRKPVRRRYSFYMPKDSNKPLHITSRTTVREVIEALLDKYNVTDNPRKFALYEKTEETDEIVLRKMNDDECPLVLSLMWANKRNKKSFSLQENERGEIDWEAFEFPELRNFLVFLNREEEDMISQVRKRYETYKALIDEAIDYHEKERSDSDC